MKKLHRLTGAFALAALLGAGSLVVTAPASAAPASASASVASASPAGFAANARTTRKASCTWLGVEWTRHFGGSCRAAKPGPRAKVKIIATCYWNYQRTVYVTVGYGSSFSGVDSGCTWGGVRSVKLDRNWVG